MTELTFHVEPDAWLPVAELLGMFHPHNSQTRNAGEMGAIKRHLQDEGFTAEMIVVNPWNRKIVSGHGRTQAAHELGHTGTLPVVYREYKSEAEHRRAMLRWNLARGHQDEAKEAAEFAALLADFDRADLAADFASTEGEFAALLREFGQGGEPAEDPGPQTDRAAELQEKWSTKPGQLWSLDSGKGYAHRLICGNCTDRATVERVMGGERADFMVTDPPYCSGGFQESGRSGGSVGTSAVHKKIESDTLSTRGYIALMKSMLSVSEVLAVYIFTDWRMWVNLFDAVESSGFGVRQMIVWDKGTPGMGHGWRSQHELIMFALKGVIPFDKFAHAQGNVIQGKRTGNELHTTQKPVELIETILSVMRDMKMVFDPFAGSGTTVIACEQLGRKARMIEISPNYCAVILQRFADMTGQTPVLLP